MNRKRKFATLNGHLDDPTKSICRGDLVTYARSKKFPMVTNQTEFLMVLDQAVVVNNGDNRVDNQLEVKLKDKANQTWWEPISNIYQIFPNRVPKVTQTPISSNSSVAGANTTHPLCEGNWTFRMIENQSLFSIVR